jgi:tetratricopeptide (TPR) repeat protein
VSRHVATCSECTIVIAETAAFLEDPREDEESDSEPSAPSRSGRPWLAIAAAVAVVCVGAAALWRTSVHSDPLRELKTAALSLDSRPTEGMLDGFEHRPYARRSGGDGSQPDLKVEAAAERVIRTERDDAVALHARGVAALFRGDSAHAVSMLTAATRRAPREARFWSDLAAAQIAAGVPDDSLRSAEQAITLAPHLGSAHFNRGIALEQLGRDREAERSYQTAGPALTKAWQSEAQTRAETLSRDPH